MTLSVDHLRLKFQSPVGCNQGPQDVINTSQNKEATDEVAQVYVGGLFAQMLEDALAPSEEDSDYEERVCAGFLAQQLAEILGKSKAGSGIANLISNQMNPVISQNRSNPTDLRVKSYHKFLQQEACDGSKTIA